MHARERRRGEGVQVGTGTAVTGTVGVCCGECNTQHEEHAGFISWKDCSRVDPGAALSAIAAGPTVFHAHARVVLLGHFHER